MLHRAPGLLDEVVPTLIAEFQVGYRLCGVYAYIMRVDGWTARVTQPVPTPVPTPPHNQPYLST